MRNQVSGEACQHKISATILYETGVPELNKTMCFEQNLICLTRDVPKTRVSYVSLIEYKYIYTHISFVVCFNLFIEVKWLDYFLNSCTNPCDNASWFLQETCIAGTCIAVLELPLLHVNNWPSYTTQKNTWLFYWSVFKFYNQSPVTARNHITQS